MRKIEYDRNFLKELDKCRDKVIYARITSLTFEELPIQTLEGRVTSGSINLDGDSAVRRSCSLSMVAKDVNVIDYYWGLNTKFTLEIGVQNSIDKNYDDIIWFPQGIYLITNFSTSLAINSYTINIQGKDKMCLLNGEVGGSITAPTQFDSWEEEDQYGNWNIKKYPIKQIIRDMVHEYAKEPFQNIVINDLDELGLELLEYRFDEPLFLIRNRNESLYFNGTFNAETPCIVDGKDSIIGEKKDGIFVHIYDSLVDTLTDTIEPTVFKFPNDSENAEYCIAKIEYGDTAGYRLTDLIYPNDLIGNVGETLTSVLDKIKNMLGDFEYFYDIDGKFIFQHKKNFVNSVWTPIVESNSKHDEYVDSIAFAAKETYAFSGGEMFTALNNNPNLNNIKNDFSVWGTRKGSGGADLPIHMRYAIDEKPVQYTNLDGVMYTVRDLSEVVPLPQESLLPDCLRENFEGGRWWDIHDWAEVYKAYTGAYPDGEIGTYCETTTKLDLNKYFPKGTSWNKNKPLFLFEVNSDGTLGPTVHNPPEGRPPSSSCFHFYSYFMEQASNGARAYVFNPQIPTGTKILYKKVDWREIIYQMQKDFRKHHREDDFALRIIENNKDIYPTGMTGYESYYIDLEGFWRQLYYPLEDKENDIEEFNQKIELAEKEYAQANKDKNSELMIAIEQRINNLTAQKEDLESYYEENFYPEEHEFAYWNKAIYESPQTLNFWFDFLDADGILGDYSCKAIGQRTKSINDSNVKSIYFRETPMIVFSENIADAEMRKTGYRYFQMSGIENMFSVSTQGKSAKDVVDDLLYQHSYAIESINITSIPIYYLTLNTRVSIDDDNTGIHGGYIISKLTLPLTHSGTMNITAKRAVDAII